MKIDKRFKEINLNVFHISYCRTSISLYCSQPVMAGWGVRKVIGFHWQVNKTNDGLFLSPDPGLYSSICGVHHAM